MHGECDCGGEGVSPTRRESAYGMVRVEDAVQQVLAQTAPLEAVRLEAHEANGYVLAEPVFSTEPLPPFRASIMDGYAVVAADGVGTRIAAGDMPASALVPGQVAYITTGSPVPEGADAVVKVEDTSAAEGSEDSTREVAVNVLKAVKTGQNIRAIGSDISPGELLVDAHELVTPAEIGLLATAGITEVTAHRRPIVGVLSTGSELVEAFQGTTTPGKIRDSNRPMLLSLIAGWGVKTVNLGVCSDSKDALRQTMTEALAKVDVLITSGGVSMGDHDLIKPLLEELGTVHFGRLLMKPGKPTTFATLEVNGKTKFAFALPGNPVSSFTTCHLLVHPALRRLRGLPVAKCQHAKVYATLTHPIKLDAERPEFHRANVEWDAKQHKFISDRVSAGISTDLSGPAMIDVLRQVQKVQIDVVDTKVVPDEIEQIQAVVKEWADSDAVDLILTSGGTGFSPRDVTPEAIKAVLDKEIPGFTIAMLESSLKITAKAVLSRPVAGIRKNTLIVTLPGKPKAVVENFSAIAEVLPHALHLVRDPPPQVPRLNSIAMSSDPADDQVELFKVKKLIKSLQLARGNGTSMISLIIPPKDQIPRVSKMLSDEMGTASNIKSRVNRLSVLGAITSTQQRLKLYNKCPPNGLIIYCGTIITDEGKEKRVNIDFEPFKPINTSLYMCDNKFHTEALGELLQDNDRFGFIVMDGNGALYGTVAGSAREILHKFSVDLPKKHGRGGQSALRFARLRMEKRHNYVRKVAEMATQLFITNDKPNISNLVLAGSADFKNELNGSDLFDKRLAAIVVKVVDVSYGGENGFNQAIELAAETLANVKFVQEKKLIVSYMEEIAQDSGKYCFGVSDTMKALDLGAVETLILWEDLPHHRFLQRNETTGVETVKILSPSEESVASNFVDAETGAKLETVERVPLVEWFANNYKQFGTALEFVTARSQEGSQFCQGFGGIGGILRWKVDFMEMEYEFDDDDDFDEDAFM
ncbi:hypothetical protein BBJ28_00006644 [Nothophytophthora sp. Chile5]|nr:hypothetical protein BBJ28_00006644 [Nothophytophthora sp. Chile5]